MNPNLPAHCSVEQHAQLRSIISSVRLPDHAQGPDGQTLTTVARYLPGTYPDQPGTSVAY